MQYKIFIHKSQGWEDIDLSDEINFLSLLTIANDAHGCINEDKFRFYITQFLEWKNRVREGVEKQIREGAITQTEKQELLYNLRN